MALRNRYGQRLSRTSFFLLSVIPVIAFVGAASGLVAIFGADTFGNTTREWFGSSIVRLALTLTYVSFVVFYNKSVSSFWNSVVAAIS